MDRPNTSTRPVKLPTQPTPPPSPYDTGEPFLSIADAAAISRIHPRSLYRKIMAGKLPCYGSTNNYRVKLSDVLPSVNSETIKTSRRSAAVRKVHAEKARARHLQSVESFRTAASILEKAAPCPF